MIESNILFLPSFYKEYVYLCTVVVVRKASQGIVHNIWLLKLQFEGRPKIVTRLDHDSWFSDSMPIAWSQVPKPLTSSLVEYISVWCSFILAANNNLLSHFSFYETCIWVAENIMHCWKLSQSFGILKHIHSI